MNFSIDFENERLSLANHVASNVARKADAKRLVVALTPILEEKNGTDPENERLKAETLRTLGDHGRTVTVDELINLTDLSGDGKAAFKRRMRAKERKMQREIDRVEIHHYLNQTLNSGLDPSDPDEKRTFYLKLAIRAIDEQWSRVNDSIVRDRDRHLARTRQFDRVKRSFSLFVDHVDDRLRRCNECVIAERSNTERPFHELEDRMFVYEDAENKVLKLLKRMAVPEGCYTVLTWLSPAGWKQERGVAELNYDFARSAAALMQ